MKLDLFDTYNIRARFCASIILFAPIAITIFFCFEDIITFVNSSLILSILLAFTNYVPILQRRIRSSTKHENYAAMFLHRNDRTIDTITKQRYYEKLSAADNSFSLLLSTEDENTLHACCESAVVFLRNRTRNNALVLEENINYGFCKNLMANRKPGIALCLISCMIIVAYSLYSFDSLSSVALSIKFAFIANITLLCFWIWGINDEVLKASAIRYAKTLLEAIDSL